MSVINMKSEISDDSRTSIGIEDEPNIESDSSSSPIHEYEGEYKRPPPSVTTEATFLISSKKVRKFYDRARSPPSPPSFDCNSKIELSAEALMPCTICGKSFVSGKNLSSHLKTHTSQRPYQCLDCGKSFSLRNTLICHTRVHTKEKPYTCTLCFKSFTQASTLKAHVIYKHTKQFPYICGQCGRGFISPGQKLEHTARVHGPKPFRINARNFSGRQSPLMLRAPESDSDCEEKALALKKQM